MSVSLDVYSLAPNDPFFAPPYSRFVFTYWDKYVEERRMPLGTTRINFDLKPIAFLARRKKLRLDVFSLQVYPGYSEGEEMEGWVKEDGVEVWRGMGIVDEWGDMYFRPQIEVDSSSQIECGWERPMDRHAQFAATFTFTENPPVKWVSDVQYAVLYRKFVEEAEEMGFMLLCMTHGAGYLGENFILRRRSDGLVVWLPMTLWRVPNAGTHQYYGCCVTYGYLRRWFPEWNENDWDVFGSVIISDFRAKPNPDLFWTVEI